MLTKQLIKNPDAKIVETIEKLIKENDGHCPCLIIKNNDTICPCKTFREDNFCRCKLYI